MNCLFKKWKNVLKYFSYSNLLARRPPVLFCSTMTKPAVEDDCSPSWWKIAQPLSLKNDSCHHLVQRRKPGSFRPIFSEEWSRDDAIVDSDVDPIIARSVFLVDCYVCSFWLIVVLICCCCCHHWCCCFCFVGLLLLFPPPWFSSTSSSSVEVVVAPLVFVVVVVVVVLNA